MEKSNILSADILDILFDGRNKSYGAYELRKTYDRRIIYALSGTFLLCLFFIVSSIFANGKKHSAQNEVSIAVELKNFKEEAKPEIPKPIPKEIPKIEMAKVTIPKIVPDEQVKEDDVVKEADKLDDVKIGTANIAGEKDEGIVAPPVETHGISVAPPKAVEDIDGIYITVQNQAQFPGGMAEWNKYLKHHLNVDVPTDNGAPPADYTVTVSFVVDRNGVISDVKADNDPGYGTKAEAIKVIQKGPNWIPAEQNGHKVAYRQRQNITFRVTE